MAAAGVEETNVCSICHDTREDGTEVTALLCGCVLHTYCLERYKEVASLNNSTLRCPTCRQDMMSMLRREQEMQQRGFAERHADDAFDPGTALLLKR